MSQTSNAFLVNNLRDSAVIGNGRTVFFVKKTGSIDFACAPDFDSPSVFSSSINPEKGGSFSYKSEQEEFRQWAYRDETAVLETLATTQDSAYMVSDFMDFPSAERAGKSRLYRLFECTRGTIQITATIRPAFDDARSVGAHEISSTLFRFVTQVYSMEGRYDGPAAEWRAIDGGVEISFELSDGEAASLVIEVGERSAAATLPVVAEVRQALERTAGEWRGWSAMCEYRSDNRSDVVRSAIVLKLLSFAPTGAILKAPTMGLAGDERFANLFDAASIVKFLTRLGYREEARAYMLFLRARYNEKRNPTEPWKASYPIRGGAFPPAELARNEHVGAPLVLAGEVLSAALIYLETQGKNIAESEWNDWKEIVTVTAQFVTERWREKEAAPDVYSKAMAWVALESAMKLAGFLEIFDARVLLKWRTVKEEIRDEVRKSGLNPATRAFTADFGKTEMDSVLLRLPFYGFIQANDPSMLATTARIMSDLTQRNWVHRQPDAIAPGGRREPAIVSRSFDLIRILSLEGHLEEALKACEALRAGANDLGLFAESLDAGSEEMSGCFPSLAAHLSHGLALLQCADVKKSQRAKKA